MTETVRDGRNEREREKKKEGERENADKKK